MVTSAVCDDFGSCFLKFSFISPKDIHPFINTNGLSYKSIMFGKINNQKIVTSIFDESCQNDIKLELKMYYFLKLNKKKKKGTNKN